MAATILNIMASAYLHNGQNRPSARRECGRCKRSASMMPDTKRRHAKVKAGSGEAPFMNEFSTIACCWRFNGRIRTAKSAGTRSHQAAHWLSRAPDRRLTRVGARIKTLHIRLGRRENLTAAGGVAVPNSPPTRLTPRECIAAQDNSRTATTSSLESFGPKVAPCGWINFCLCAQSSLPVRSSSMGSHSRR